VGLGRGIAVLTIMVCAPLCFEDGMWVVMGALRMLPGKLVGKGKVKG
jgi:hypothetical protein